MTDQMVGSPLASRLKDVRLKELGGMSQDTLARQLSEMGQDVKGATVRRYERGEREPPASYIVAFAKLARIDPGWLLTGGEPPSPNGDYSDREEAVPEMADGLLDRWGYQRAKAIADLAELLREDCPILRMRAEATLNASKAALIEAEKAPDRNGSATTDQTKGAAGMRGFHAQTDADSGPDEDNGGPAKPEGDDPPPEP